MCDWLLSNVSRLIATFSRLNSHTSVTVNRVRCSGPITNTDFLCRAVWSTRGDRTLHLEYLLQTLNRFLTSRLLHSLLPCDAYA